MSKKALLHRLCMWRELFQDICTVPQQHHTKHHTKRRGIRSLEHFRFTQSPWKLRINPAFPCQLQHSFACFVPQIRAELLEQGGKIWLSVPGMVWNWKHRGCLSRLTPSLGCCSAPNLLLSQESKPPAAVRFAPQSSHQCIRKLPMSSWSTWN